jgi:DNA-binding MarR family transcriptional regulator
MAIETTSGSKRVKYKSSALTADLSFLLARANALALAAAHTALAPFDLKVRSYAVLSLACSPVLPTQRDLAEFLRLDPSQIVSLVDDLESRRLVERQTDAADRRSKVVVATPAGRALQADAEKAAQQAEKSAHAGLSDEDRRRLADLLRTIAFAEE